VRLAQLGYNGSPMKNATSLESTLDQLVSAFVQALLEAALRATPSEFAAASEPNLLRVPGTSYSRPAQGSPRERSRRAPSPQPTFAGHPPSSLPRGRARPAPGNPPHGEEASPAHAITDPALLLQAIDDATASSEPPVPGQAKRVAPASLEAKVVEASTESTLRAGEEVLRRTGGGVVFRRVQPGRASLGPSES
jgi:hypothetical protein